MCQCFIEGLLTYGVDVAQLYKGKVLFVGISYGLGRVCFFRFGMFEPFICSLKNASALT